MKWAVLRLTNKETHRRVVMLMASPMITEALKAVNENTHNYEYLSGLDENLARRIMEA